ncbi:MAG: outer membrane beta-barrel protein [Bacteroidota bacterium]|nr:outer membrane beta-barrel protein [Candidatus Kapabacteria bacterium]MCS7303033.1 outer membrane beta-barrel protein [Candidatus Kapabacteria bacterium]MCX7936634.1 outer membrane beta-barrel protein [Chlorobiota bacterium]MDW8075364.1 outer membrane beta-barrel protein [Bacteroidota bacterium]
MSGRSLCTFILLTVGVYAQQYLPQGSIFGSLRLGIGPKENAFNVGIDGEYTLTAKDQAGPGILNIGLSVDYSQYSKAVQQGGVSATQTTTVIPITVAGVYHLSPSIEDSPEIDPYILAGFAYRLQRATSELTNGVTLSTSDNDIQLVGGLGAWYFFTPRLAAHLRIAFAASFLTVGIVYRFQ